MSTEAQKCDEAVEFLKSSMDAESNNRALAISDLRFAYGDQWPNYASQSRGTDRPQLTINKVDAYCRQVENSQRQQRPRIKAHPVDDRADVKIAEVITGLCRHIEVNSDADHAYDTAFSFACRMGWGYWRLRIDYIREDSFFQDIFIDSIENPFTVYFDPTSTLPDGSDAEKVVITDKIAKAKFRKMYPGRNDGASFSARGTGDNTAEWLDVDTIRIAEYYFLERTADKLVQLSDGSVRYESRLPSPALLDASGLTVVGDRASFRKQLMWRKQTAFEILDEKKQPGRYIPVVPCYGAMSILDGKRDRFGLVRFARDPQMMYNFWRTAMTESVALAPKAKWLIAEGQDEGHENEWNRANLDPRPVLRYSQRDTNKEMAPPPTRLQPEPPPLGAMESATAISSDLQAVLGIVDPAMRITGPVSGKALNAEKQQSDNSNFHLYDNLTRSIKHTGRIIIDWVPEVYTAQRVSRIIGDDGKPDMVTINEQAEDKILNDVTVGTYDVVMETGPGYNSRRQESLATFTEMMGTPLGEEIAKTSADLIVRMVDAPNADVIADRLAASNPLAQVDEKSEVPPAAQMQIKQLQANLQAATQHIQGLELEIKTRGGIEQMKQDGETRRELMRTSQKAHSDQVWSEEERAQVESVERTKVHDTTTRALSAQHVAEIDAFVDLVIAKMSERRAEKTLEKAENA